MATCGDCRREITWATDPEGNPIALDKALSYDGATRFSLQYKQGGGRPNALPITRRGAFAGYHPHADVCGKGTPS
jgi:hypothetical protein